MQTVISERPSVWRRRSNPALSKVINHWQVYLMLVPGLIILLYFRYLPLVYQFIVAFKEYNLFDGLLKSPWVGWANFRTLFDNPEFPHVVLNTIEISLLRLVVGFFPPIIVAILLYDISHDIFKRISQTIMYIPHFFSWVIMYGFTYAMLAPSSGFINNVLGLLHLQRIDFFMNDAAFRPIIILTGLWKELGFSTILYMAALSAVDPVLYEAALVDGAGPIQRLRYVTLPSIKPIMVFVLTISLGFILEGGTEQIQMYIGPLTRDTGEVIGTWILRYGIQSFQFGLTSVAGMFQSLIGFGLVLLANWFSTRYAEVGII